MKLPLLNVYFESLVVIVFFFFLKTKVNLIIGTFLTKAVKNEPVFIKVGSLVFL